MEGCEGLYNLVFGKGFGDLGFNLLVITAIQ